MEGWPGLGQQGRDITTLGTCRVGKGLPHVGVKEQLWLFVQKLLAKL